MILPFERLMAQAKALAERGRMGDALASLRRAMALSPADLPLHLAIGAACSALGRNADAAISLRRAILSRPDHAAAHYRLGKILAAMGERPAAERHYRLALAAIPAFAEAHHGLALLHPIESARSLHGARLAWLSQPYFAASHDHYGNVLRAIGRSAEARRAHCLALALAPAVAAAWCNLGSLSVASGDRSLALNAFHRALRLDLTTPQAANNLGNMAALQGDPLTALRHFQRAEIVRPDYPELLYNGANIAQALGRFATSESFSRRALLLRPDYVEAHNNRGNALISLGEVTRAGQSHRTALCLDPAYEGAWNNLGLVAYRANDLAAACDHYRRALSIRPDFADAHTNFALALLAQGAWEEGWREYEWRWQNHQFTHLRRDFAQNQWRGEAGEGRWLLIHAEQGFGDSLQFCRFIPDAAARGWRVALEVPKPLARLLAGLPGVARLIVTGEALPEFDSHCPMLSLPLALGITLASLKPFTPYLTPQADLLRRWQARLSAIPAGGVRVGLVWAGNPRPDLIEVALVDRRRSLDPQFLQPLRAIAGVQFFSLQRDQPPPVWFKELHDLMGEVTDFADTAALIAGLDLVISVDSAVAHLAAGMGKTVWLLDRHDPCWRWLRGREDSPFYPSLRIFRQKQPGDWAEVMMRVQDALRALSDAGMGLASSMPL